MAARRIDPRAVKLHRSYDVSELAARLGIHKNTVRHWQRTGLHPVDDRRPFVFAGADVRAFLTAKFARCKAPCAPGTLYCFKCRTPRPPALGMVDYIPITSASGNLKALCETCSTTMHRRVRATGIALAMPGCDVRVLEDEVWVGANQPFSVQASAPGQGRRGAPPKHCHGAVSVKGGPATPKRDRQTLPELLP